MFATKSHKIDYGNWISMNIIIFSIVFCEIFVFLLLLSITGEWHVLLKVMFWFLTIASLLISAYFIYARYQFADRGGGMQEKIRGLLVGEMDWDGQGTALDIGCGNGPLTIRLAQQYPEARLTGIYLREGGWEYARPICEKNAEAEGVMGRIEFVQASATALPFEDESFDLVVSNLAFHKVKDVQAKKDLIKEALRVLKKGGVFAFQDLFWNEKLYGDLRDMVKDIKKWGVQEVVFVDTSKSELIPRALKLPFMVGPIGMIRGVK
jgi:ubiquinone/menaquinone biosynthesis C-methylase UbiE